MKIKKEKRIREEFVNSKIEHIAELISRSTSGELILKKGRKSYRNICQYTGRSRGNIKDYKLSRYIYRNLADKGKLEGVRRAS